MDKHQGHGALSRAIWLPMAVAQNLDIVFDLKESFFRLGEAIRSLEEIPCERLQVSSTQPTARTKHALYFRCAGGMHL
jgi:hypothetical protein